MIYYGNTYILVFYIIIFQDPKMYFNIPCYVKNKTKIYVKTKHAWRKSKRRLSLKCAAFNLNWLVMKKGIPSIILDRKRPFRYLLFVKYELYNEHSTTSVFNLDLKTLSVGNWKHIYYRTNSPTCQWPYVHISRVGTCFGWPYLIKKLAFVISRSPTKVT